MDEEHIPTDFAIDALALETDRRSKAQGRPYSYGHLIADTTREQREKIAENYRKALTKAQRKGHRRVRYGGMAMPPVSCREVEDALISKMESDMSPGE